MIALALATAGESVPRNRIALLTTELAVAYASKTDKTLTAT
jgi:hypothetical protein